MLQRAARNAYSWWWASHIRTKQSKWLDQNMQDMEEKVEYILKIINEEGDSFAVRAEMYYRKRPELVNFVEDCFRNYRALAERYDHLSRDFQTANRTIATVFPERVQMAAMEEGIDDDETFSASENFLEPKHHKGKSPAAPPKLTIPKIVSILKSENSRTPSQMMSKKGLIRMNSANNLMASNKSSGLTKEEAFMEIDKIQKGILGLQTEKEFVKSSIDSAMMKCHDIEKQVTEMQARVSSLEDEFGIGTVIEDDEARSLMASTALKSCRGTLVKLQEKQEQMANEALVEHQRVKEAKEKFETLVKSISTNQKPPKEDKSLNPSDKTVLCENQPQHPNSSISNQTVPSQHKAQNPIPSPSNQRVPSNHEPGNPSWGLNDQNGPMEHESPYPSLSMTNQMVEHQSPNPNQDLSNQRVLREDKSPHASPNPSNQRLPSECKSLNPSNQSVPGEFESQNPSNQMVPEEQNYTNPSLDPFNQIVHREDNVENQSPSSSNHIVPIEHESQNRRMGPRIGLKQPSNQAIPKELNYPNPSLGPNNQTIPGGDDATNLRPDLSLEFKEKDDKEMLRSKIKDQLLTNGDTTGQPVSELAENIDELVDKVIRLETEVNSQSALLKRLKSEADQLQAHMSSLEDGKNGLSDDSEKKNKKLSKLEEELCSIQSLDTALIEKHKNLEARVTEVSHHLEILNEKLPVVKVNEEEACKVLFKKESAVPGVKQSQEKDGLPQKGKVRAVLDGIQEQNTIGNAHDSRKEQFSSQRVKSELNGHLVQGEEARINVGSKKKGNEEKGKDEKEKNENLSDETNYLSTKDEEPNNQDSVSLISTDEEDQPNWKKLFLNGLDDTERTLVEEYTSLLGNYKQIKKKLSEVENRTRASNFRNIVQIKVLKNANASKDEEIKTLHRKLNLFITTQDENPNTPENTSTTNPEENTNTHESTSTESTSMSNTESTSMSSTDEKPNTHDASDASQVSQTSLLEKSNKKRVRFIEELVEEQGGDIKERAGESMPEKSENISLSQEGDKESLVIDDPHVIPFIEEKIRMDIDDLLEDNIEFWLRFSTSIHQIKKFQNSLQDLQEELKKVMGKRKKHDESSSSSSSSNTSGSELRAIYKHLREIETEITLWTEHSSVLRDDLQNRMESICTIEEEITRLFGCGNELGKTEISDYQGAKFQGEVMNMKQENKKVTDELLTGLDRVKRLRVDLEKTIGTLEEELGLSTKYPRVKNNNVVPRNRIPLSSFLFGTKLKKQKPSLFSCISPQLQRQYSDLEGMPT